MVVCCSPLHHAFSAPADWRTEPGSDQSQKLSNLSIGTVPVCGHQANHRDYPSRQDYQSIRASLGQLFRCESTSEIIRAVNNGGLGSRQFEWNTDDTDNTDFFWWQRRGISSLTDFWLTDFYQKQRAESFLPQIQPFLPRLLTYD